ncbi:MAG: hypothetical protein NZ571_03075 [Anaerolineae bacterium]|nr:hypothetical protein [Anaerolineae bacterium]
MRLWLSAALVLLATACSATATPTIVPHTQTPVRRAEPVVVATLAASPTRPIVFVVTLTPTLTPTVPPALLTQTAAALRTAEAERIAMLTRIAQATAQQATRIARDAQATAEQATQIARDSQATAEQATRIARDSRATAEQATRIARNSQATAEQVTKLAAIQAQSTATAFAVATVNARTRVASNALPLPSGAKLLLAPSNGELYHNPSDGFVSVRRVDGFYLRDGMMEARFYTPYTDHDWSHGFFFRDTDRIQYRLVISSDRRYALIYGYLDGSDNWQYEWIQTGNLPDYTELGANSSIAVRLVVQGGTASLFINGELTAALNVSRHQGSGAVSIGTGFYRNSEKAGAVTRYEQFAVWSLDPATATPARTFTRTPTPTRTRTRTPIPPTRTFTRTPVPTRVAQRLCPNSPLPRLSIGDIGYVVYGYGPSNLNKYPRRSGDRNIVVDILKEGDTFRVVGGPQCGNGLTWWQVRYLKNNFLGWIAEGEGDVYWLDKIR